MMETAQTALVALWQEGFGSGSRLWPLYLLSTLLIAFVIHRRRRVDAAFLAWLMPRTIWTHPSHLVDIKLFVFSKLLSVIGLFQIVAVAAGLASLVAGLFPVRPAAPPPHPLVVAALLLIVGDFATYWVHRIHHEMRVLWPFHAVHHSAEVMTPITAYRKHPVYDLTKTLVHGTLLGLLQGCLVGLFAGGVGVGLLMGVNAGYFLFNMLGSNFRHSHVHLGYGRVLEHLLISPAQHQIHHSIAPEHHNRNYGEVLAIWDWIFGTLCLSRSEERLEFGLGDRLGARVPQPHDSLAAALILPLRDSVKQLRKLFRGESRTAKHPVTPAE